MRHTRVLTCTYFALRETHASGCHQNALRPRHVVKPSHITTNDRQFTFHLNSNQP